MEWTIRLEAKTGWGEVETVEVVRIARPVLAATGEGPLCPYCQQTPVWSRGGHEIFQA